MRSLSFLLVVCLVGCASGAPDAPVGYKLGFTSSAAQQRFGVSSPAWGRLRRDMRVPAGGAVAAGSFSRVFVEAEIAFTIGHRLDVPLERPSELLAFVRSVHPALELPDWRFAPEAQPSFEEIVSDGVGAHRFVLGPGRDPELVELETASVTLERDGQEISRGRGADALGSPWHALLWLNRTLVAEGAALEPGDVVLTGALGSVRVFSPGQAAGRYRTTVEGLGSVEVTITAAP